MTFSPHTSAKPTHYNQEAASYDTFNEENSKVINQTIEQFLKQYQVKRVLDLTCGTGSQVFWLAKRGYEVVGSDFNAKMLKIAKEKAKKQYLNLRFLKGDMRTIQVGEFDAVLTIFNAVGHLTREDFEEAMGNIHRNLKAGGLYIFDIFNLDYLRAGDTITKLTIDSLFQDENKMTRKIQYSTIDEAGILASYTTLYTQEGNNKPKILRDVQTLQVYTTKQLHEMLQHNGFAVLHQCAVDGTEFLETQSERILIVGQKV